MNDNLGASINGLNDGQRVFGRFTLKRLLGRGGMGVVWQAHDESLNRDVALKFLPERVALDREAIGDLKRETRRALELTHSRIVRIYDFVQDAQSAAISMEYVDGASLTALKLGKPEGHFEVEELRPLAGQLCEALTYAHGEAKVIHRDLKPSNLMVNSRGELKITDFGISAKLADLGLAGTLTAFGPDTPINESTTPAASTGSSGTPVYMSPQQMMGEKPTVADDIYSLGSTLYELLTGKPPFYSGHVIAQVQEKVPPTIAERRKELGITGGEPIPAAWEKTIAACLAKKPTQRPKSAAEVAARLRISDSGMRDETKGSAVESPSSQKPTAPGADDQSSKAKSRKPKLLLLAALAGLVLLGAAALILSHKESGGSSGSGQPLSVQVFFTGFQAGDVVEIEGLGLPLRVPPTGELGPRVNPEKAKVRASRAGDTLFGPTEFDFRKTTEINLQKVLGADGGAASAKQAQTQAAADERPRPEALRPSASQGPASDQPSRLTEARGGILVHTTPEGAEVRIGAIAVEKSPLTLKEQKPGHYPVHVRLDGYENWDGEIDVKENEFAELNVPLVRSTGAIQIGSSPAGLPFTLEGQGRSERGTTPAKLDTLPTGDYLVTVSREGWPEQKQSVDLQRRQTAPVLAEFAEGSVQFTTMPAGARALITGSDAKPVAPRDAERELLTPFRVSLKPGTYEIEFRLDGHRTEKRSVEVLAKREISAAVTLEEQSIPQAQRPWENGLGMKFVPVPGTGVLFSIWETRVQDFEAFVKATGHDATASMYSLREGKLGIYGGTWKKPGFPQGPTHPVVGVDKDDAKAFCAWLTQSERAAGRLAPEQEYRLPTDGEWSAAAGPTYFPWGDRKQWPPPSGAGNYADESAMRGGYSADKIGFGFDDGFAATAPVGSFKANSYGIYDLGGNVWERTGVANGLRGAAFDEYAPSNLASSYRTSSGYRLCDVGFRVVCVRTSSR